MRPLFAMLVIACLWLCSFTPAPAAAQLPPTLTDFWDGRAAWQVDIADVGLPVGESDTLDMGNGILWSYLHASHQSAGVVDSCGDPAPFPGCLTIWQSTDGGRSFSLPNAECVIPCAACPCDDARDHSQAQQYPRVVRAADGMFYLAYEWHAQIMLRRSEDGVHWSDWVYLLVPGGTWPTSYAPCSDVERIGTHPNIRGQAHNCLVGAPPGLALAGDTLYIFATAGSAPSHLRCYVGDRRHLFDTGAIAAVTLCPTDPLFGGAREYGPPDITSGAQINPYFDFRYVSSAEVLAQDGYYYLTYEGIRGPDVLERGMDTQFGLGMARATALAGPWQLYPANPILMDVAFNWGIGHADLIVLDGQTYLYSATDQTTRGRYLLQWIAR
jgi:hypothetical protein